MIFRLRQPPFIHIAPVNFSVYTVNFCGLLSCRFIFHIATFILDAFENMYSNSKFTDIHIHVSCKQRLFFIIKMKVHHHTPNFFTKINNSRFVFAALYSPLTDQIKVYLRMYDTKSCYEPVPMCSIADTQIIYKKTETLYRYFSQKNWK